MALVEGKGASMKPADVIAGVAIFASACIAYFPQVLPPSAGIAIGVCGVILASVVAGRMWHSLISNKLVQSTSDTPGIDAAIRAMSTASAWLQPLRFPPPLSASKSGYEIPRHKQVAATLLNSMVFGLFVLAIAILALILSGDLSSQRGVFGALLIFPLGRAAAGAFCTYLSISTLSLVVAGLLSKFAHRRNT
jgi:hypothetical protein